MIRRLLDPWHDPARLWWSFAYLVVGLPVTTIAFTVIVVLLALATGLIATFLLAIPAAWLLFVSARGLTAVERSRSQVLLDRTLPDPVPPLRATTWLRRIGERVTTRARWREVLLHLVAFPVSVGTFSAAVLVWCGSLALAAMPLYVGALPGDTAKFWLFEVGQGPGALGAAVVGAVGLAVVAPWTTIGAAGFQVAAGRLALGRSNETAMAEELRKAEGSRSAAVDSAEAERRRIERDLHDGAQQRLVALAAGLGAARQKLDDDPVTGRAMVAEAHEEAKAALKDLRDLVRGIHPVILEDRGLDAALSAVIARAPVPVSLDVHVEPRPSAATESAAYFVVNEALTNVARHAQATRAKVSIARTADRLVVEVHDDGIGGADVARGSGLAGLHDRVAGMGGSMYVISPDGGPTTISVELPCAS